MPGCCYRFPGRALCPSEVCLYIEGNSLLVGADNKMTRIADIGLTMGCRAS